MTDKLKWKPLIQTISQNLIKEISPHERVFWNIIENFAVEIGK